MKKSWLLFVVLFLSISSVSFAQSNPEVPRSYKPKPKELLPMPGELTDEMIFPVLGSYEYTDKDGNTSSITVSRDADNKGVVWVNGLPQGRFKADLKASPATYKIPGQKTLQNEVEGDFSVASAADSVSSDETVVNTPRFSGKSISEGTMIFDSLSSKLYVNVGKKFKEDDPASVFPEMNVVEETDAIEDSSATVADSQQASKKSAKKKKPITKSITYILTKVASADANSVEQTVPAESTEPAEQDKTDQ